MNVLLWTSELPTESQNIIQMKAILILKYFRNSELDKVENGVILTSCQFTTSKANFMIIKSAGK